MYQPENTYPERLALGNTRGVPLSNVAEVLNVAVPDEVVLVTFDCPARLYVNVVEVGVDAMV